jgi:uncharacterized protein (DUF433 family)
LQPVGTLSQKAGGIDGTKSVAWISRMISMSSDNAVLPGWITIDPAVCHGKPTIRDLRYPVESILEYLAGGDSFEEVLAEFPDLEREDLLAFVQFAARSLKLKSLHVAAA